MRRGHVLISIACCLGALLAACYGRVLWGQDQFGYRDAAQYFYPLYWQVQAEWRAGRVPLWEPGENAGTPLLANASAAVLYPGKVLYALLPYPWAARLYVVTHTALAFATMTWLLRSWGTSAAGSTLAGLAYAFGAPVLFQYCNVIYLVGSAWAPLGLHAADRWVRLRQRSGLIELAVVLALVVLGGDPQTAYLLVVCAVGYALGVSLSSGRPRLLGRSWRRLLFALGAAALAAGWVLGTIALAWRLPAWRASRPGGLPPPALPWMPWVPAAVLAAWTTAGLALLARWRRRGRQPELARRLIGLALSVALALGLAAAQLLPAIELSGKTDRASFEDPIDVYPFSLEPLRVIELFWPNVFGSGLDGNRSWLEAIRPQAAWDTRVWVPSLYLGGLTLVLAAGALGFRGERPQRGWLSALAVVSLLASFGEFTGPLWWARYNPAVAAWVGPHDPPETLSVRHDGQLRDGDGSVYWLLAAALPGFRRFRYPSKFLTFTALALSGLAGMGWDRLAAGDRRSLLTATAAAAVLLIASLACLLMATWAHPAIVAALRARAAALPATMFGPLDAEKGYDALRAGLAHGSVVQVVAIGLVRVAGCRHRALVPLALAVMTADLAVANARLVLTVPQSLFDTTPAVVRAIEDAERQAPDAARTPREPFRVHRMARWYPAVWERVAHAERIREFDQWERDTIAPKYGLPHAIEYTVSSGVAEIDLYAEFFGSFRQTADAATAAALGLSPGQPLVMFPRRAFDMWNTRYFVLPAAPNGWNDETRAYAAFVHDAERIDPPPDAFAGPDGPERRRRWVETKDFQVFRNRSVYPRAWVVHDGRFLASDVRAGRAERDAAMQLILSPGSPEPRQTAWLEPESRARLAAYLPGTLPLPAEAATITHYDSQRVEIDVAMARPGLLILADTYDAGWRLVVDGVAAPIYRVNRMMRAAALGTGRHHLIFRYAPRSFRIGVALNAVTIAALAATGLVVLFRRAA
jgi:hypothetical protein